MAWWAPEEGSRPACVSLCELPSKRVFRTKNLVYVKDVRCVVSFLLLLL